MAFSTEMHAELDHAALRAALTLSTPLPPDALLFVNVLPPTLYEDAFCREELPMMIEAAGLTTDRVVLEITEQLAISNFGHFRQALKGLRALGFLIALDDVGAAQANLDALSALSPNFVKVDASIASQVVHS